MLLSVLGKGSYAEVILAKKKDNGKSYALKVINKKSIRNPLERKLVLTERNVLAALNHPFIIKLHWAFQSLQQVHFVLEYCPGGELFNLLQKCRTFTETQYISIRSYNMFRARFYIVQIVLALEHLHSKDIVYRE